MKQADDNSKVKKTAIQFAHKLKKVTVTFMRGLRKDTAAVIHNLQKGTAAFICGLQKGNAAFMRGLQKATVAFIHGLQQATAAVAHGIRKACATAAYRFKKACAAFARFLKSFPWKRAGIGIGVTLAVCLLAFLLVVWRLIASAPSIDSVNVSPSGSATWICDEKGNPLRKLSLSESNRDIVTLDEIPAALQNAVIAIEDSRFYEHNGIDLRGIARAFWSGITNGSFSEGASTITQQLIKNSVFTDWTQESSFAERFARKVQEQYLALQLEEQLSKEEILEDYLNTINFGSGCYGVEAAAQRYFGKEVSALTLSESAVLAAIPQNPTGYSPIEYPEANQTRQRLILRYMEEQGYITHEERMEALGDDVYTRIQTVNNSRESDSVYTYYEDALIEQVTELLMSELNYSSEQASHALYSGGLRIYSAQDTALQEICDEEFQNLSNFPESTQVGVDYTLRVQETDGSVTTYGSEALLSWVRENIDVSFDLLCETQDEAQSYADAFREAMLNADSDVVAASGAVADSDAIAASNAVADSSAVAASDAIEDSESTSEVDSGVDSNAVEATGISEDSNVTKMISTSVDSDAIETGSTILSEQLTLTPQPQASLVLIDQETGFVRAIVGGRGEKTASLTLNRASGTTRQPGSTFKILTAYAPALNEAGQTLATLYENEPFEYENGTAVSNWDITDYSGAVTIREAITRSINVVAVHCITEITPRLGFTYAENFGISTLVDTADSTDGSSDVIQPLALGGITNGVTNLELCAAYAAIANGGMYAAPLFFTKILDRNGTVLLDATGRYEAASADSSESNLGGFTRVLKKSTAWLLTSAMEDVVSSPYGTAYGTVSAAGQPVAGKTGTTSSYKDIWFVGYTPYYTCSVWGGYDNNQSLPDGSLWHSYSRILWTAVMERIHANLPVKAFEQPDSIVEVTLCSETHLLAQENCPSTCTEFFARGTEPDEVCSEHQPTEEAETESETEEILIYQELLDDLLPETENESEENDQIAAETESENKDSAMGESEPDFGFDSDLDSDSNFDSGSDAETEAKSDAETKPESDDETMTGSNSEAEAYSDFGAEDNPDFGREINSDFGTETDSGAETKANSNSESESKRSTESAAETESDLAQDADTQFGNGSGTGETSSLDDMLNRLTDKGFSFSP
ncbi:MAG: transglycosylase domain-containing protein [Lachnospiraceae bacterium]|nr:transglycosylase domain-containing protein [Lachnospiraceae bacterium]